MDYLFDIDGTLADNEHRVPLLRGAEQDWTAFFAPRAVMADAPIPHMIELARGLASAGHRVLFSTGRPRYLIMITHLWLKQNLFDVPDNRIWDRKLDDKRRSSVVKRENLRQMRRDGFRPVMVFEDSAEDARMYREEGLATSLVAPRGAQQEQLF